MHKILITSLFSIMLSGCSVLMAASSSKEPNLTPVGIGSTRPQVEASLGRPIQFLRQSNGDVAVYQYFTGDEASVQRAALYAVLDGMTLGIAELFTFQGEALQGDKHTLEITYDRHGRVVEIKKWINQQPIMKFEKELI